MLLAAICYVVITALLFHNLLPVLTTSLPSDLGDPLLNTSILAWNAKHLPLTAHGRRLMPVFAALIIAEGWFVAGTPTVPTPPVLDVGVPQGAVVLDLPMNADYRDARAQYLAVLGEYRVVNGYSGYSPPHHQPLRDALLRHTPQLFQPFRQRADLYCGAVNMTVGPWH